MRKIDSLLTEYGSSHKNMTNKLIHWICVPLIFFSIVGMLWSIPSNALKDLFNSSSSYMNWGYGCPCIIIILLHTPITNTCTWNVLIFSTLSIPSQHVINGRSSSSLGNLYCYFCACLDRSILWSSCGRKKNLLSSKTCSFY